MNIETIRAKVAEVEAVSYDPDSTHTFEDRLMVEFIKHVASHGSPELAAMASEVAKVWELDFTRWTA